jgi:hypothetical protein
MDVIPFDDEGESPFVGLPSGRVGRPSEASDGGIEVETGREGSANG